MLKRNLNRVAVLPGVETDPYDDRRKELHRMPPVERIAAIDRDLKEVTPIATAAATFHRKKLWRMHDAARLEAGFVTSAQLQRENDPFAKLDFRQSRIVWQPRPSRA